MIDVSIVMPIYNAAPYLEKSIQSVLAQTYSSFELILVNDGSTDRSEEICIKFRDADKRVTYLLKENGESASAKNFGIRYAAGKYCAFVDADDYLDPDYISTLYNGMENGCDLSVGNIMFSNENTGEQHSKPLKNGVFSIEEFLDFYPDYMQRAIIGAPYNKLFSLKIIKEHALFFNENLKNNEDTQFNYSYLPFCQKVSVYSEPYYYYVDHGTNSLSRRYIPELFTTYLSTYEAAKTMFSCIGIYEKHRKFCSEWFCRQSIIAISNVCRKPGSTRVECCNEIKSIIHNDEFIQAERDIDLHGKNGIIILLMKHRLSMPLYLIFRVRITIKGRN